MTWPKGGTQKLESKVTHIDGAMVKLIAGQFLYAEDEATLGQGCTLRQSFIPVPLN